MALPPIPPPSSTGEWHRASHVHWEGGSIFSIFQPCLEALQGVTVAFTLNSPPGKEGKGFLYHLAPRAALPGRLFDR